MSEPVPVTEVALPLANFKALAAGPKGSLHTALGVDHGVPLPEDLLAHAAEHHEDPHIRTRAQMVLEIKRWRASKNKYLEKVADALEKQALNSFTAREMAKRVGVIVDPNSNWKYALRSLRDSTGEPLQGRERREALNRLAGGRDILREHQQMASAQRKVRDVDEVQQVNIGNKVLVPPTVIRGQAHLTSTSRKVDPLLGMGTAEMNSAVKPLTDLTNSQGLSLSHVHPILSNKQPALTKLMRKEYPAGDLTPRFYRDNPHSLAIPSGNSTQHNAFRQMDKVTRMRVMVGNPHLAEVLAGQRNADYNKLVTHIPGNDEVFKKLTLTQRRATQVPNTGDLQLFSEVYQNKVNPIHSVSTGVVGLHKVVSVPSAVPLPVSSRSIYLKLHPDLN